MDRPYIKIRRYPLCGASPATPRGFAVHKWTRHKMRLNQEKIVLINDVCLRIQQGALRIWIHA